MGNEVQCAPLGVFDSGVGGLTVAREIMRQLPRERMIYFGDTARVPYGAKSRETVTRYSRQIAHFLLEKGVKAIVVACNTASALALEDIREEIPVPIIGVLRPGAKVAAETTRNGIIGVIATEATINSRLYTKTIQESNPEATVVGKACPLFVPLVEEGWLKDPITVAVARRYLEPMLKSGMDTLIMGCTHYPLLRSTLQGVLGDKVSLVNPAYETARSLRELLVESHLCNACGNVDSEYEHAPYASSKDAEGEHQLGACGVDAERRHLADDADMGTKHQFYVSDAAEKFRNFANSILPCEIREAQLIHIEE